MFTKENLRLLRKTAGLTQSEMAEKLHIKRETYTRYETGTIMPPSYMLIDIAKILGTSVDNILGITDESVPVQTNKNLSELEKEDNKNPPPDIKWGDFGISFYEGGGKKLTQAQKDKIAKLVQIAVMDEDEYWKNEKGNK